MMGFIILLLVLGTEMGVMIYRLMTKSLQEDKKNICRIALFVLFCFLMIIGVVKGGFRWNLLFIILFVRALMGIWYFTRKKMGKESKKEKIYSTKYVIMSEVGSAFLIITAIFPAIMFPQFAPIATSGEYEVKTVSYTLTDEDRREAFSDQEENRKVTIQFWYPDQVKEQFPLVIFSHGAFGFRGSNTSTFENLAKNGYVVCSIDYTYQSFFTKQTDGSMVMVNMDFINSAIGVQNGDFDEQTTYNLVHEWLKLRKEDMNFVMEDILANTRKADADQVYQLINPDKIGLFGHSLGGATSAAIGRERSDIDAVIVVDGTMFGEEIGFVDGKAILNSNPYPIPLLNFYNEEHYAEAQNEENESYANIVATTNAVDARQVVIGGSGHLNFTDLPMFSPTLAKLLGTGEVDPRYCIDTMNKIVLDYFNYYLKDARDLNLATEY